MYHQEERILVNKIISVFWMLGWEELRRVVTADIHKNAFIIHVLHFWMIVNERLYCFVRLILESIF